MYVAMLELTRQLVSITSVVGNDLCSSGLRMITRIACLGFTQIVIALSVIYGSFVTASYLEH